VVGIAGPNNTRIPRWPLAAARIYPRIVFAVAGVRRILGVDANLGRRWPGSKIW
jgi:hypothetical protein